MPRKPRRCPRGHPEDGAGPPHRACRSFACAFDHIAACRLYRIGFDGARWQGWRRRATAAICERARLGDRGGIGAAHARPWRRDGGPLSARQQSHIGNAVSSTGLAQHSSRAISVLSRSGCHTGDVRRQQRAVPADADRRLDVVDIVGVTAAAASQRPAEGVKLRRNAGREVGTIVPGRTFASLAIDM